MKKIGLLMLTMMLCSCHPTETTENKPSPNDHPSSDVGKETTDTGSFDALQSKRDPATREFCALANRLSDKGMLSVKKKQATKTFRNTELEKTEEIEDSGMANLNESRVIFHDGNSEYTRYYGIFQDAFYSYETDLKAAPLSKKKILPDGKKVQYYDQIQEAGAKDRVDTLCEDFFLNDYLRLKDLTKEKSFAVKDYTKSANGQDEAVQGKGSIDLSVDYHGSRLKELSFNIAYQESQLTHLNFVEALEHTDGTSEEITTDIVYTYGEKTRSETSMIQDILATSLITELKNPYVYDSDRSKRTNQVSVGNKLSFWADNLSMRMNFEDLRFTSTSDASIISIDAEGLAKGLKAGKATVTIGTTFNEKMASVEVTVI